MNAVRLLSPAAAIASVASSLRLPAEVQFDALVGQALRRAAYQMAPCARHALERSVSSSLNYIAPPDLVLDEVVAEILETLIVYGEVLELQPLADDKATGSLVLRPSPAFFVRHHSGSAILIGVAGDEITPLSPEQNSRLRYQGPLRIFQATAGESVYDVLRDSGLSELASATWLRLPPQEAASGYVAKWTERLRSTPAPTEVEGLTVFEGGGSDFYSARRVAPRTTHSGIHVGRRPQMYGADLWCLVELVGGRPAHLLDLVSEGDRLRPSDIAWRILMALDCSAGQPQRFRVRPNGDSNFLDFFAPVPSWALRRIAIDGAPTKPERCLLTFEISEAGTAEILPLLRDRLWLDSWSSSDDGRRK